MNLKVLKNANILKKQQLHIYFDRREYVIQCENSNAITSKIDKSSDKSSQKFSKQEKKLANTYAADL